MTAEEKAQEIMLPHNKLLLRWYREMMYLWDHRDDNRLSRELEEIELYNADELKTAMKNVTHDR